MGPQCRNQTPSEATSIIMPPVRAASVAYFRLSPQVDDGEITSQAMPMTCQTVVTAEALAWSMRNEQHGDAQENHVHQMESGYYEVKSEKGVDRGVSEERISS